MIEAPAGAYDQEEALIAMQIISHDPRRRHPAALGLALLALGVALVIGGAVLAVLGGEAWFAFVLAFAFAPLVMAYRRTAGTAYVGRHRR
ncbi:hypothetical protein [Pseudonocardia sp. MH-G8]|uniref:hypothetical protein n=1 Tax=Pseudonocardia sp. MH-G8 TaxID=1854588 RepID=UPI000BA0267C|nr:hypothetical protein [Pseudonocardia sp. MH-G8]OZM81143.1 hypothetical protein CFP66_17335 [Pseudonocardia sp. MH-G8]